jgi:hypothetical protein
VELVIDVCSGGTIWNVKNGNKMIQEVRMISETLWKVKFSRIIWGEDQCGTGKTAWKVKFVQISIVFQRLPVEFSTLSA